MSPKNFERKVDCIEVYASGRFRPAEPGHGGLSLHRLAAVRSRHFHQEDSLRQVSQTTGSISLTIRFALPQTAAEVAKRAIKLQLTDGSQNSA